METPGSKGATHDGGCLSGRSSPWPLATICVGYFMVILDTMVVNVALPALSKSLHTSTSGLQWIVDAYSLVFGALLLSAGALGDRRGVKAVFQLGIALFAISSLACGLAPTTGLLIAARCAQGLGAALAVPASLSLLQAAYHDQVTRRRAFGIWGAVAGIAAGAGPVVGGALVSGLGWRSVFFVNVPVGAAGMALAARHLPSPPRRPHRTDIAGQDLAYMRKLLATCTDLMSMIAELPQPVVAKVHALATAAGAQLVSSCDLAVAASTAGFATPGGKGGWFCHTPMVAISRAIGRKRAAEMALTGDVIPAAKALEWGLVNYVVEPDELDAATDDLLARATRGSAYSKAMGKTVLYRQMDLTLRDAYSVAVEAMAGASQTHDAQEGMAAFLEKRPAKWQNR